MIRIVAGAAVAALAVPATAQVTSVERNNAPLTTGDPNKIVCKKEETIGTRLGTRKVCLTAQQWVDKHKEHREFTERIQSGTWPPKLQTD